jgi:hypothetical protein
VKVGVGVGTGVNELGNTVDGNDVLSSVEVVVMTDMTGLGGAKDNELKTSEGTVKTLEMLVLKATSDAVEIFSSVEKG